MFVANVADVFIFLALILFVLFPSHPVCVSCFTGVMLPPQSTESVSDMARGNELKSSLVIEGREPE